MRNGIAYVVCWFDAIVDDPNLFIYAWSHAVSVSGIFRCPISFSGFLPTALQKKLFKPKSNLLNK